MLPENKKNEGPTCACGKGDLYEEWKKLNKKNIDEVADSTTTNQTDKDNNLADDLGQGDQTHMETEK